jgi:type IV secretory pathway TraG/TraD family ATPase VirD4
MSVEKRIRLCLVACMLLSLQSRSEAYSIAQTKLFAVSTSPTGNDSDDKGDDRGPSQQEPKLKPRLAAEISHCHASAFRDQQERRRCNRTEGGAALKLTRKLIRECCGPETKISSRFPFDGYSIKTEFGSTAIVTEREFKEMRGGADLYEGIARLGKALGWEGLTATGGGLEHAARMLLAGQSVGLPVETGGTKRFFGLIEDPPVPLPRPSGVLGNQGLGSTNADLQQAGLLNPQCEGVRVGASWESGEPIRSGRDAENSIIGFGPPGSGKGVAFEAPAIMEFHGSAEAPRGSSFTIDPSGQLFMICAPELQRQGVRVLPIMLFPEDFPAGVRALAKRSRCMNPMDGLDPHSISFGSDCYTLGHILRPADKTYTGGDPFFKLSGGNLITTTIGCVKLYSHPSEQNLCEVYHKLGDVFAYMRWVLTTQRDIPRFIMTQARRWTAPLAEANRTLLSIVETALSELAWLGEEAAEEVLRTSSFDWDDLKNGSRPLAVFFLLPVNRLDSHKPFLTLGAGTAIMGLGKTERGRLPVLVTLDEAGLLDLPILMRAFAEMRKRGVTLSVWYQNIFQAEERFGPAWKTLLSGSDLQIYLRPRDLGSAEHIAHQIGSYTQIVPHFSSGAYGRQNVSFSEQGRPVLFPQELMNLPEGAAILIAPGRSKNALQIWARPWFDCPDLKDKGGIDDYHRHRTQGDA